MRIYTVEIDRSTGEWLNDPIDMNESTTRQDWNARTDSDSYHYDTAEIDGETVAMVCEYID
jgi:hypothetical protein